MPAKKTPARISIDFSGLKEQIEEYRADTAWRELTFNGKVRTMIADLINLSQRVDTQLGKIICDHWEDVTRNVSIPSNRLRDLRLGHRATDAELVQLATVLPYDTHQLAAMQEGEEQPNKSGKQKTAKQLQKG